MAVFCDFENIALGVRDAEYEKFDMRKVMERLLLKGSIVVKKAYCDWDRYKAFKAGMHEASFELIEIPHVRQSGKNSADIRMVVDALDLCYTKAHVDTFVIVSGDSDFSPLVSKLRENDKKVIGVGVKNSTSDLLIANCDEFIFYDDLVREQKRRTPARKSAGKTGARSGKAGTNGASRPAEEPAAEAAPAATADVAAEGAPAKAGKAAKSAKSAKSGTRRRRAAGKAVAEEAEVATGEAPSAEAPATDLQAGSPATEPTEDDRRQRAIDLVMETVEALLAERGNDIIWGSMVKQTLKRRQPGFNESYYGYRSFNALLEDAAARGLIALTPDDKSGGFKLRLAERVE